MWSAIIGSPISIEQVVMCMVALKLAREAGQHEDDNIDDAIGYLDLLKEVQLRSGMQTATEKLEEEIRRMTEVNREEVERQKRQFGGAIGGARGPIFPGQG